MVNCTNANYKKGSTGLEVKELQTILKNLGFYQGRLDGDFGEMTVNAVILYQRSQNLLQDGWIGPVTCNKLQKSQTTTTTTTTINDIKDITGKKFYKEAIQDAAKTYRTHIKNNKNYPNYLTMIDSTGKKYNVGRAAYMGIFEDVSRFFVKNGREPNYVVADGTANNPLAIDYQNNGWNCGPTSLSMCFQMLGKWITEPTLATACGTTRAGTGPAQLISCAKKYGFNMVEIPRHISNVRKAINEGSPVLMHIHTSYGSGKSCLGYSGAYGHYIMCYGVTGDYYLLADPTKGFKKCYCTGIDNAKSSTNMKYYRISPL